MKLNAGVLVIMRIKCDFTIFVWILVSSFSAGVSDNLQKRIQPITVWTEVNGEATLPCNFSVPQGDKVNMILWFKDATKIPIYSYDTRESDFWNGIHLVMSDLEKRCTFITIGQGRSSMNIYNVTSQDVGLYKCRVDLLNSPTQNYRMILKVADIPSPPVIELQDGSNVGEVVGPYFEGESVNLKCSVNNGIPSPLISWWVDDEQLNAFTSLTESTITSHLNLQSIPRSYNAKLLQCQVNIAGLSKILKKVVYLNIYVKPLMVSILNGNNDINDGESTKFVCDCFGSNPEAVISWLLDGEPIRSSAITVIQVKNTTSSTLTIRGDPAIHGKFLLCRCENPKFSGFFIEDKKYMQVIYKPTVQIRMRSKHNFSQVEEGDDVSLECLVNSNPAASTIQWYQNGKLVDSENEMIYNLRNISSRFEGEYECEAFNKKGQSRSPKLMVNVLHAPFCQNDFKKQSILAAAYETIILQCKIEIGTTNRHVQFYWTLNDTIHIEKVSNNEIQSVEKIGILKYTPETEEDFGEIACWAQNDIGVQKVPCFFFIRPADKPSTPMNCITNNSDESIQITCEPGFDGGLKQYFVLEVHMLNSSRENVTKEINDELNDQALDAQIKKTKKPLYKMQKETPVFYVYSLEAESPYIFMLYAVNLKGKSKSVIISQEANKRWDKHILSSEISASPDTLTMPAIYIAIMALILLIASLVIMTAIILACRGRNVIRNENVNELNNFRIAFSDVEDKRVSNYETEF